MSKSNNIGTLKSNAVPVEQSMQVADAYEYSMAQANFANDFNGQQSIFNAALRGMPTNKVVGEFEYKGVKYPELKKRNYMINAGLEQILACLLADTAEARKEVVSYFKDTLGVTDEKFLSWLEEFKFTGEIYGMEEGVPFFGHQPLVKIVSDFESGQIYESVVLSILNRQINVATTAYDVYQASGLKMLLEGASRRSFGLQDSLNLSRAAIIGGFTASSNVKFGIEYDRKVGGTHGHSYVLAYPSELEAFRAQAKIHGNNVTFLLDTYGDIKNALFTALKVVDEFGLTYFKFRLDSGDLLSQALWIHDIMKKCGFERAAYDIVVSDDLNAGKVKSIEEGGGDIASYLLGTFLSIQSKGPGIVYKLTAKNVDDQWVPTAKFSEDPGKATIGGDIQVYRITGPDGFYVRDVIALADEHVGQFISEGESAIGLITLKAKDGQLIKPLPTLDEIVKKREEEMAKFKDIENYIVVRTRGVVESQESVRREIERQKESFEVPEKYKDIYEQEVLNKVS